MKIYYVGNLPKPYGGVTIKNLIISETLKEEGIEIINLEQKDLIKPSNIMSLLRRKSRMIIGISGARGTSIIFSLLIYLANKKSLGKSIYFMMGGKEHFRISSSRLLKHVYSQYKCILVESKLMKEQLEKAGFNNIVVYPNCRKDNKTFSPSNDIKFSCAFMSKISVGKGANVIFDCALNNPEINFYFYGDIDPEYEREFLEKIRLTKNATYLGVFKNNPLENNVVYELDKHDLLLLPTTLTTEGFPGILLEAKFSGIPSIVSSINYNSEIVTDGYDGCVVDVNDLMSFSKCLSNYYSDFGKLISHKRNSYNDRLNYSIDEYIPLIIRMLEE